MMNHFTTKKVALLAAFALISLIFAERIKAQSFQFGLEYGNIIENQFENDNIIFREFPTNDNFYGINLGKDLRNDGTFRMKLGIIRQIQYYEVWYPELQDLIRTRTEVSSRQYYLTFGYSKKNFSLAKNITLAPFIDAQILIERFKKKGGGSIISGEQLNGETGEPERVNILETRIDAGFKANFNPFIIPGIKIEFFERIYVDISYRQPILTPFYSSTVSRIQLGTKVSEEKSSYSGGAFILSAGFNFSTGKKSK